jgi:sigma-E factor negative regulatory protein RseC
MHRIGQITEIRGDRATIALRKHAACGDCGACQIGEENMEMTTEAINDIQAPVGAFVEIDMADQDVLKAAFIVYLLPLMVMLSGIAVTFFLVNSFAPQLNPEILGISVGVIGMILTYLVIRLVEDKTKVTDKYMAHVVKRID